MKIKEHSPELIGIIGIFLILYFSGFFISTYSTKRVDNYVNQVNSEIKFQQFKHRAKKQEYKQKLLTYIEDRIPDKVGISTKILIRDAIFDAIEKYPVYDNKFDSVDLIVSVIKVESSFNRQAKSPVGAIGLMQLMPQTASFVAKMLSDDYNLKDLMHGGLFDPYYNIQCGSRYLYYLYHDYLMRDEFKELSDRERTTIMILMYNFGPENKHFREIENIALLQDFSYYKKVINSQQFYSEL